MHTCQDQKRKIELFLKYNTVFFRYHITTTSLISVRYCIVPIRMEKGVINILAEMDFLVEIKGYIKIKLKHLPLYRFGCLIIYNSILLYIQNIHKKRYYKLTFSATTLLCDSEPVIN